MKRILFLVGLLALPMALDAQAAKAGCQAFSSTQTYTAGSPIPDVCDTHGARKVMTVDQDGNYVAGGGAGGGDASAANQTTIIGHVDGLEGMLGATGDAASAAGSTGSINAKLRRLTTDLDALNTLVTALSAKFPAAATPADNTALGSMTTVAVVNLCYDGATTDLCVKGTAGAGAVDSGTARVTLASDDPLFTGASIKHFVTAGATEDETEVKATAGRLLSVQASNSAATVAYLRCANLTAANTTPGTSTVFWGMAVPGATTGAGVVANFGPMGIAFSTGLTCWVVGGKAETDVAEVGANDVQVNIQYK